MKRSTKVVVLVVGSLAALMVLLRLGVVAHASALGLPLATAAKLSAGVEPSCEEKAAMGIAMAERHCRAAGNCRWDPRAAEEASRKIVEICHRDAGRH